MDEAQRSTRLFQCRIAKRYALRVCLHLILSKRHTNDFDSDIDGDGKADAIWIHPNNGSGVVWQNKDPTQGIGTGWVRTVKFPISIIPS